ncbi:MULTISPECIES: apolipoprotein N-acyltransferase [unclassified Streptomyces]|uniref:apolipoprotein N-acyltransferase n=1 Tax=Streptomyces TaxID=1883 RepID=UPI0021F916D4|nr:apolipoprotein N-acyltransferase [Streptomyces sp. RS2]MCW1099140.1 apolipoprotein N-acyltransferase [Streptomyces sp. RS2]
MTVPCTPASRQIRSSTAGPAPTSGPRLRGGLLRPAQAAGSGLLLYASFPPRPLWWLAPVAFALLASSVRSRRPRAGFGYGYLAGLGFFLPLLVWTGEEVGPLPWLALAAVEALFIAGAGSALALVGRLPGWPVWAAAVWVTAEAARARLPFGGFSWGKVAFGQAEGWFLPLAAVGGTALVGFAVALCGFALADLAHRMKRPGSRAAALAALAAAATPVAAAFAASPLVSTRPENGTATAAVIQGNVPRLGLDFNAQRRAVLDNHARRTIELADDVRAGRVSRPDFVLWPENSSDLDPYRNTDARAVIHQAVAAIGAPTSVGAVITPDTGSLRNTQILWDPRRGPVDEYDKRRIQPFGEYIPLRPLVRIFSSDVDRVQRDFGAGRDVGVFTMSGTRVGLVTCYENAFDDTVRDTVTAGAQVLSVPSNNATFGRTEMTYQQLAMSRLRAVEHSRTVLVPVTSGVSAVILPDGTVTQRTGQFVPAALVAQVPRRSSLTPATRLGPLPEAALATAALAAVTIRAARDRITTRRRTAGANAGN